MERTNKFFDVIKIPRCNLRRTDGGSDGGVRGRGGCRWIEQLAVKGVGCVRARRRRSTASRGEPENSSEEGFSPNTYTIKQCKLMYINSLTNKYLNSNILGIIMYLRESCSRTAMGCWLCVVGGHGQWECPGCSQ